MLTYSCTTKRTLNLEALIITIDKNYLNRFDAFLFDLDGTLVDSMNLHNQAWISTLKDLNYEMTTEILFEYAGITNHKIVELFNHRFHWKLDADSVVREKEHRFLKSINQVKPIESVVSIAKAYFGIKPMAIVSGGAPDMVLKTLNALNLDSYFPVKVCAGDTVRGKPFADPFLSAAQQLQVAPAKCLVFEDGEAGIVGAKLASMSILKVQADHSLLIL